MSKMLDPEVENKILAAKKKGTLDAPIAGWLDVKNLPPLKWEENKQAVDLDIIRFMFSQQGKEKRIVPAENLKNMYNLIERGTDTVNFAHTLLNLVLSHGGMCAKNQFAYFPIATFGDERIITRMKSEVLKKPNFFSVRVIGFFDSPFALRTLYEIILAFKTKHGNIRTEAIKKFERKANERKMTYEELEESIIPDFGFTNFYREFEVEGKKYRGFIGANLKIMYENVEKKKILPSLPKTVDQDLKEELSDLNKEIKKYAKIHGSRMEEFMNNQIRWNISEWEKKFLRNPLIFAIIQNIVWGVFEHNKISDNFMVQRNFDIVNITSKKINLPAESQVGILHPLDLSDDEIKQWIQNLSNSQLDPPFSQISRKTYVVAPQEKNVTRSSTFEKKPVLGGTFSSRALKRGWKRGSVADAGGIPFFLKEFPNFNIIAYIEVSYVFVGMMDMGDADVGKLGFAKIGSISTGGYSYDYPQKDSDPRLIPFGQLPKHVYSETILDLEEICKAKSEKP